MSERGIIYQEVDKRCEYCGKYDECRPYGKNDEQICFMCGQKDIKTTEEKAAKYLFGGGMIDWHKFWDLFHEAWGNATNSPEYNKTVFNKMQQMLQRVEKELREMSEVDDIIENFKGRKIE